jgi:hypothetical protein
MSRQLFLFYWETWQRKKKKEASMVIINFFFVIRSNTTENVNRFKKRSKRTIEGHI